MNATFAGSKIMIQESFTKSIENTDECLLIVSNIRDSNEEVIDYRIEYLNKAVCKMTKLSKKQQIGKSLFELFPNFSGSPLFNLNNKLIDRAILDSKFFLMGNGSDIKDNKMYGAKIMSFSSGYIITWKELKGQKHNQCFLEQINHKFATTFENALIGVLILNIKGRIIKANKAFEKIIGYSEEELIQKTMEDITHPEDFPISQQCLTMIAEGTVPYYHLEEKYLHKDGNIVWCNLSVTVVKNSMEKSMYMVCQVQDITKIKKANESLEQEKLKAELFANVSHELKTPVNIIMSTLQLFTKYLDEDKILTNLNNVKKYAGIMRQNCFRLIRLIGNLIDTTRIEASFYEIQLENHNIVKIIENVTLSVAEYIKDKGIELIFDSDIDEKIVACDPDKIERIILNLLSNSAKFTQENGKIKVALKDENENLVISVKDNGIGMQKDKLNFLFKRFGQIDKSLTRNREGSGIGLSLVKSFVEMHGGTISAKSEYGIGSEFIIKLPTTTLREEATKNWKGYSNYEGCGNFIERVNVEFSDVYFEN